MRAIGDPWSAAALVVAGLILGTSFHSPSLTPFSWFALAVIAMVVRVGRYKWLPAYVAGVVFQLAGVAWMTTCYSNPDLTEARLRNWLLLGLYFGTVLPVVLWLASRMRSHWRMWIVMPIVWTVGDLLRFEGGRFVGGQYPWLALGYSQTGFIAGCQVADIGGVWAVGFMAAMFGGVVADTLVERRIPAWPALFILAGIVYGEFRIETAKFTAGPAVALIPGREIEIPSNVDLALWSECAFSEPEELIAYCPTVQGCLRYVGDRTYNSAIVETHGSRICYDKCNLVPYSESDLTAGQEIVTFSIAGNEIGLAICYDIGFTRFMRKMAQCDMILVPANEASDPTMILAEQLLAMARLRAVENRRTIVRNANGGYSGVIDGNGRIESVEIRQPNSPLKFSVVRRRGRGGAVASDFQVRRPRDFSNRSMRAETRSTALLTKHR